MNKSKILTWNDLLLIRTGLVNFYGLTKLKYVFGLIFVLHLDSTSKRSAKGVVKHSQQQLAHQRFRETLLSGKTLRIHNYSIKSKANSNISIAQNRIALSPFDSKRFLLFDGIARLPFGHKSTEENVFFEAIAEESDLANSQLTNTPTNRSKNSESCQSPEFLVPDLGFLQKSYTEEEFQEESAASSSRDPPPINNPFILTEASVSSSQKKRRKLDKTDQKNLFT